MELRKVSQQELEAATVVFSDETYYDRLLSTYLLWHQAGFVQKHYTHDSTFFLLREEKGFKAIKFYDGGIDIRISGHLETIAEAYNEATHGF